MLKKSMVSSYLCLVDNNNSFWNDYTNVCTLYLFKNKYR